ncbi:MAG: ion transporter, partial [Sphingomonadales bacterium]|nr:ion transporter [Sphingomonadales bacterium]
LARVWVCIDNYRDQKTTSLKVRLRYITSPMAIIDFVAIMPFYLVALGAPDLRFLRIFRLLRLLKLVRYSHGLTTMGRVLYDERRSLTAALIIMIGATFFAATIMHFIEKDIQPDNFGSIPHSLWWAIATLTTVGYGDVVPYTGLGRLVGGMVMIFGLAFYAIPIGIVASAFTSEIHRRDFVVRYGLVARVPLFEGLDPDTISDISSMLRAIVVERGTVVSHVGEEADGMYFLVSGDAIAVFDDKRVEIAPGSFFGEISLLRKTFREVTVVAESTCKIMLLESHDFQHLLMMRPVLKERLESMVENRLGGLVEAGEISIAEKDAIQTEHKNWFSNSNLTS